MALNRYVNKNGTNVSVASDIYSGVKNNLIACEYRITTSADRLDLIAYEKYDDPQLWWVIAAASGIGWWLQVPEGVKLSIPVSIEQVQKVIGV